MPYYIFCAQARKKKDRTAQTTWARPDSFMVVAAEVLSVAEGEAVPVTEGDVVLLLLVFVAVLEVGPAEAPLEVDDAEVVVAALEGRPV